MLKKIILILLILINLAGRGQDFNFAARRETDSLKNLLPGSGTQEQVDILNGLASIYARLNFDSSIYYSAQAMRMATIYGYSYGIGCSRLYAGNAYYYKMDFKNAMISYLAAQTILEEGAYYDELGESCMMLGHINFFIMRKDMAITLYNKAFYYFKASGNETSLGEVLYGINMTYWRDGPIDSALVAGKRFLEYARKYHNRLNEALALISLGMTYNEYTYNNDSLLHYNIEGLKIAQELKDERLAGIIYFNAGFNYVVGFEILEKQEYFVRARFYYNMALQAARSSNYNLLVSMIHLHIAYTDQIEGQYDQAKSDVDMAESFLQSYSQFPEEQPAPVEFYAFGKLFQSYLVLRTINDIHAARFDLAKKTGQFEEAVKFQQLYFESGEILRAAQQGRQLELLMAEAEAERTNKKISALAQENELNMLKLTQNRFISAGIASFVVIISLFLLLYFQRKRLKAEQRSILNEQRLLRAQMNPHFLFNSLASIQNYIINEDTDRASIYLSRFSQLVRNILDNSVEEYVPVEKEIETVRNYLELQKVRYAGKFDFNIDVDVNIDEENMMIPPMLAQPFIENAIEHGIKPRETPGRIDIRFHLEDNLIRFEVEDDGVGREKAREIEASKGAKHRSMATSITTDRLATLNKKLKKKIRMEIVDLKDEEGIGIGTRVAFGIPVVVR